MPPEQRVYQNAKKLQISPPIEKLSLEKRKASVIGPDTVIYSFFRLIFFSHIFFYLIASESNIRHKHKKNNNLNKVGSSLTLSIGLKCFVGDIIVPLL